MEKLVLKSESREIGTKLSDLRNAKRIPAVVYGHGMEPIHVSVEYSEFLKIYRKAKGTHLIDLMIEGKARSVLAHEVQKNVVTEAFIHIDFFAVSSKEKIHVQVPVALVGKSQAAVEGAEIEQNLHALDVKVLPVDLVDAIEVDITALVTTGDIIHVSDVVSKYPKLEILTPETDAIVAAHAPRKHADAIEAAPLPESEKGGEAEDTSKSE